MNKFHPTLGAIAEAATQEDRLTGRPLPFSNKKGTNAKPPMSWGEYGASHFLPIPLTGASREAYDSMRERGLSAMDTTALLKAAAIAATEATGVRNYEIKEFHKPSTKIPNLQRAMRERQTEGVRRYLQTR